MAIKKESVENTAVKPTTFVPFLSEDIVPSYATSPAMPVSSSRVVNQRAIPNAIEAPEGTVTLLVEPKTFGHFLLGVYGTETVGRYVPISTVSGTFTAGETITGGTSAATAVVTKKSSENDYLLTGSFTGTFTAGETITGGSSGATAVVGVTSSTVYGHEFLSPQSTLPTFTVEFGYANEAIRYTGVRFASLGRVSQQDNIIMAEVGLIARAEFKHARVTAITTAGSTKTITVDQTTGLVATDSIKLFRPSTSAFVETNTVLAVVTETTFTVSTLANNTAVGDLIVLAPQTASYTIDREFSWIGSSTVKIDDTMTTAIAATAESVENFELSIVNDIEARYAATGTNLINRFPATNFLKGLTGEGQITKVYTNQKFLDRLRTARSTSMQVKNVAQQIGSTGIYYTLDWRTPNLVFSAFQANLSEDDLVDQEMPFVLYNSTSDGYMSKAVLINDITAY